MALLLGNRFFLRERTFSLDHGETITDASHRPVVWVRRRRPVLWIALAALAVCAILGLTGYLLYPHIVELIRWSLRTRWEKLPDPIRPSTLVGVVLIAILASVTAVKYILPRRRIDFYRDPKRTERVLELERNGRWQWPTETYTLRDATGNVIATIQRVRPLSLFVDRWTVIPTVGTAIVCKANERPIILAALRRFFGSTSRFVQTDVMIVTADAHRSGDVLGRLERRRTECDRYTLDLTADPTQSLDRRIAIALGVLMRGV